MKYYKRSSVIEAITFDELVQHGIDSDTDLIRGMPWHFKYNGVPITHENDNCYLIASPIAGSLPFNRGDMLTVCGDGALFPMSLANFFMIYAALPEQLPPPPPEQEGITVKGGKIEGLAEMMRECKQGGPAPDHV